ncbi:MAG: MMPL family transporter [Bacilli bacterium]|nr:MMPL family transporter [Bacilli bacterium]
MFGKLKYWIVFIFCLAIVGSIFLIPQVNINYNVTEYLPDDSKTKEALVVLDSEFGQNGYLQIMIENINDVDIVEIKEKLFIDNVKNVETEYKDKKVLFKITLENNDYDETSQTVVREMIEYLDTLNYDYYINGQAFLTYNYNLMIKEQIPKIILFLIPIILLILTITTTSFFDPLLFALIVGISIVLNMGTNAFLPNVSYMTHAISAILQFAICMDYSIILLHRYRDCRKEGLEVALALKKAWRSSLVPIIASSLTTVAGFVAIMFMRYKIGLDVGIVLSKGVLLTLITVIFLMPCLILVFNKVLEKGHHKQLLQRNEKYNHFLYKTRYIFPIIAIILIAGGAYFQSKNDFTYSDNTFSREGELMVVNDTKIRDSFGINAKMVILLDKDIDTSDICTELEEVNIDEKTYIKDSISFTKQMDRDELSKFTKEYGLTDSDINSLFKIINNKDITKLTVSLEDLSKYLIEVQKINNSMSSDEMLEYLEFFYSGEINNIEMIYQLLASEKISLLEIITFLETEYDYEQMSSIFGGILSTSDIMQAYNYLHKSKITIKEFIDFNNDFLSTQLDITSMAMVLNNSVETQDIEMLYGMFGRITMSIKEIIIYMNRPLTALEMKNIFANIDGNIIDYAYEELKNDNVLLEGDKTSIKVLIPFIENNFSEYLDEQARALFTSFNNQMVLFGEYEAKINILDDISGLTDFIDEFDLSSLSAYQNIDNALIKDEFVGIKYQRIILTIDLPEENETSFSYYELLNDKLDTLIPEEHYVIAQTLSVLDIKNTSSNDYLVAMIISIVLVFIIIMISFKSLAIPMILIVLIEGAIFINMSIPALIDQKLLFMGYLIVSCIQLGATIDYGILMSNRYITNRKEHSRKESMALAIKESMTSILTSGSILTVAGLLLGVISDVPIIAILGRLIGIGAIISVTIVIVVLPQVLYIADGFIAKTTFKSGFKLKSK